MYQELVDQINQEIVVVKRRIEAEKVAEEQEKLRRLQDPAQPWRVASVVQHHSAASETQEMLEQMWF